MKVMKKLCALLLAVAMSASMLTACGSSSGSEEAAKGDEQVTVEFWTLALQPTYTDFIQGLIDKYEADNPNVKVNWQDLPYDAIEQKLLAATAGSNPPDVVNIWSQLALTLAGKGALLDLEAAATDEQKSIYIESMYNSAKLGDGVYAFPWYATPNVTVYNTELLAQAGITEIPATWDEAFAAAKDFKDKTGAYLITPSSMYHMLCYYDIPILTEDKTKAAFNNPEAVELLSRLVEYVNEGAIAPNKWDDWDNDRQQYANDKLGMLCSGPQTIARIRTESPEKYAVTDVAESIYGPWGYTGAAVMNLVVPANSKHQEEGIKFANYLSNDENQLAFAKAASIFPTTKAAAADDYFKSDMDTVEGRTNYYASLSAQKSTDMTLGIPNDNAVKLEIDNLMDMLFASSMTPEDALAKCEQSVNQLLAENQ